VKVLSRASAVWEASFLDCHKPHVHNRLIRLVLILAIMLRHRCVGKADENVMEIPTLPE